MTCSECGREIPSGESICPACNSLASEIKDNDNVVQKVEVTAINLQVKRLTIKYIYIAVIAVLLIVIALVTLFGVSKKREIAKYQGNLELVSEYMLQGAAKAENACNLILNVWQNSIYEEYDSQTDKYTLDFYGNFYEDFNDALTNLYSDTDFIVDIYYIDHSNQKLVLELMGELNNPPQGYEDAYEAAKDCYYAYLKLTNLAIEPQGSLLTFSSNFNAADSEMLACYNALKIYT